MRLPSGPRDSNHHRQSVSAGKTNTIPTEPSGRLLNSFTKAARVLELTFLADSGVRALRTCPHPYAALQSFQCHSELTILTAPPWIRRLGTHRGIRWMRLCPVGRIQTIFSWTLSAGMESLRGQPTLLFLLPSISILPMDLNKGQTGLLCILHLRDFPRRERSFSRCEASSPWGLVAPLLRSLSIAKWPFP